MKRTTTTRPRTEVYIGAGLAAWTLVAGFIGYRLGARPAIAGASPVTHAAPRAEAKPAAAYQYKVVTIAELFPELPADALAKPQAVLARWQVSSSGPDQPAGQKQQKSTEKSPVVSAAEIQRRIAQAINRLGEEGWEVGEFAKQAWPADVAPAEGMIFCRRPR